jgi:hypothetical protein
VPLFGAKTKIELAADRSEVVAGTTVPLSVDVGEPDGRTRGGRIELAYRNTFREDYTDSDGDRSTRTRTEEVVVATWSLFEDGQPSSGQLTTEVTVPADAPGTAPGSVEWQIKGVVDRRRGRDAVARLPMTVLVPAEPNAAWASRPLEPSPKCPMTIEAGARTVLPGDRISGTVRVSPTSPVSARAIRLELRSTRDDPDNNTEVKKPVEVELSGPVDLRPGEELTLPFTVDVPDDAVPSFRAKNNELHWHLAAVVDVKRAFDPTAKLEVLVHTA